MDDVSKLGPLWVAQLTKEVARRRNAATESLLLIDQDGDFAKQHLLLIGAANTMLAAPQLMTALRNLLAASDAYSTIHAPDGDDVARMVEYAEALDKARTALAAAGEQP